jgi:hypothetical protein
MKRKLSEMEEVVQCPVCHVIPRAGPIYQCVNGHLICKDCEEKVTGGLCPVCRVPLPPGKIRNLAAEQG